MRRHTALTNWIIKLPVHEDVRVVSKWFSTKMTSIKEVRLVCLIFEGGVGEHAGPHTSKNKTRGAEEEEEKIDGPVANLLQIWSLLQTWCQVQESE